MLNQLQFSNQPVNQKYGISVRKWTRRLFLLTDGLIGDVTGPVEDFVFSFPDLNLDVTEYSVRFV